MTSRRHDFLAITTALLLGACAGASSPAVSAAAEAGHVPAPAAAAQVAPADLSGTWVEYWAVDGKADTERYAFNEPGRFDWRAAQAARAEDAVGKAGRFRLEPHGQSIFLVLEVERETFAACAAPCSRAGAPHEVQHTTPLVERHELGECPRNPEAKSLDASYTCRAIGGKAFWRKPQAPHSS